MEIEVSLSVEQASGLGGAYRVLREAVARRQVIEDESTRGSGVWLEACGQAQIRRST